MSKKNKLCILCVEPTPAGSKEHVFPAALGGRRVNRGIYCETHNGDMSVHGTALMKVLSYFNASLGVRSDHLKAPRPHIVTDNDGERYELLRGHINVAPPRPLRDTPDLVGKPTQMKFESEAQRDRWISEQREDGFEVKFGPVEKVETLYFTESLPQQISIDEAFRCAIAYVGLTYLAHYFPALAHQPGLEGIKACIQGTQDLGERVWMVNPANLQYTSNTNTEHVVAVGVSKARQRALAIINFFGQLVCAVDIGPVDVDQTKLVAVFVNPLIEAARPDYDIRELREFDVELDVGTPQEGREYLEAVVSGKLPHPVGDILRTLQDGILDELAGLLQPRLEHAGSLPPPEGKLIIADIVAEQGQLVLNLLRYAIDELSQAEESELVVLGAMLEGKIIADLNAPYGISPMTHNVLAIAQAAITDELQSLLAEKRLNAEELKLLLGGTTGVAIVLKPILPGLIDELIKRRSLGKV